MEHEVNWLSVYRRALGRVDQAEARERYFW